MLLFPPPIEEKKPLTQKVPLLGTIAKGSSYLYGLLPPLFPVFPVLLLLLPLSPPVSISSTSTLPICKIIWSRYMYWLEMPGEKLLVYGLIITASTNISGSLSPTGLNWFFDSTTLLHSPVILGLKSL